MQNPVLCQDTAYTSVTLRLQDLSPARLLPLALWAAPEAIHEAILGAAPDHPRDIRHEAWGFEWEELAAIIYLATNLHPNVTYQWTSWAIAMQTIPRKSEQELQVLLHHDIGDTHTWIGVAHMLLDQPSEDDRSSDTY